MWGYIIWGIILLVIILMLVRMRSLFSIYVCPKCETEFTLTPVREFIFPQVLYRKIARCPNCSKIVAAGIIRNEKNISKLEKMEQGKRHKKVYRGSTTKKDKSNKKR